MEITIKAELVKRTSKQSGNDYQVLVIKFPNGYEKEITFFSNEQKADLFAIQLNFQK